MTENPGTQKKPLKSIIELNIRLQKKVEEICLAGGQIHDGTLVLNGFNDKNPTPVKISSWGDGRAVINGGNAEAIKIEDCQNILITDLDLRGNGRKNGNTTNGLSVSHSRNCKIENITASGFQKSGVDLYDCCESEIEKVIASDNGFCGINIMGSARNKSHNITIRIAVLKTIREIRQILVITAAMVSLLESRIVQQLIIAVLQLMGGICPGRETDRLESGHGKAIM